MPRNRKCEFCGELFAINRRGRPQLYCKPSHRVRAHEKRRELENKWPAEKSFRLLKQRLEALWRWRVRSNRIPGLEEMRLWGRVSRGKAYQQAVERIRESLVELAPELMQDLAEPWRAALSKIEATQRIETQEYSEEVAILRRALDAASGRRPLQ